MADQITELVEHAVGSPWVYLALFAFAALDAFFPIVPSESLVISAGVFAASGSEPDLVPIILAAAAGAFLGDHISYFIGRFAGEKAMQRAKPGRDDDPGQVRLPAGGEHARRDDEALARHDREERVQRREREQGQVDPRRAHRPLDEIRDGVGHHASLA